MGNSDRLSAYLPQALHASRFLQRELHSRSWLSGFLAQTIDKPIGADAIRQFLAREAPDEARLKDGLRRLRSWVVCHTAIRDLSSAAPLVEAMEAMTLFAETSITHTRDILAGKLAERHGYPTEPDGSPMGLIIVGMGKLGGRELNVSSDIDLIFLYPADGETDGKSPLDHLDYFSRLGRMLIGTLNETTKDGFVFRVDMRLRPYGESGPLALSFDAFEHYLISQGREWERFAWIKARPLCGGRLEELANIVRPFVFRKYLDFGAFSALRSLHDGIRRQVSRREMANNIKLGPGGIREIEFIAQVFQVIRGGRDKSLQVPSTLAVLDRLAERGHLDLKTARELKAAYIFLRRLENRLQYLDDAQTHSLPTVPEDLHRVATAMDCADSETLLRVLDSHRSAVHAAFQGVCGAPPVPSAPTKAGIWEDAAARDTVLERLARMGFHDPTSVQERLLQLRQGSCYRQLADNIRERFDNLLPRVIEGSAARPNPDITLPRLFNLLETISKRGAYLAFLQQYPQALTRLIELVSASSWAASYLTTHPILLDDLLDGRNTEAVTDWPVFAKQLREQIDTFAPDTERQMDLMRDIHHSQVFRIFYQDIAGKWTVEQIGDHLSALADIMLDETIRQCWRKHKNRHCRSPHFAVIGYGKLGGKEMGYASDLDIVFLYDDDDPAAQENYARLAQRMLTWISARTSSGVLFDTDTRLRPSGRSGLLVSRLDAFFTYQNESAWLWEHQALTRARFVAGDKEVGAAFEAGRERILRQPRDPVRLRTEILEMRRKLLKGRPRKQGRFNIKDDPGGLVDFEFIVQYLVLGYADRYPKLVGNFGNIALSRMAGEFGLVDPIRAEIAADAYRSLRRMQHRLRLNAEENWVDAATCGDERKAISALWLDVFGHGTE